MLFADSYVMDTFVAPTFNEQLLTFVEKTITRFSKLLLKICTDALLVSSSENIGKSEQKNLLNHLVTSISVRVRNGRNRGGSP